MGSVVKLKLNFFLNKIKKINDKLKNKQTKMGSVVKLKPDGLIIRANLKTHIGADVI